MPRASMSGRRAYTLTCPMAARSLASAALPRVAAYTPSSISSTAAPGWAVARQLSRLVFSSGDLLTMCSIDLSPVRLEAQHHVLLGHQLADLGPRHHLHRYAHVVFGQSARVQRLLLDVDLVDVVVVQRAIGRLKVLDLDALGLVAFLELIDTVVHEHQAHVLVEGRRDQHHLQ